MRGPVQPAARPMGIHAGLHPDARRSVAQARMRVIWGPTAGACPGAATGMPRPAARPMPGPPCVQRRGGARVGIAQRRCGRNLLANRVPRLRTGACCDFSRRSSWGGGPSIVSDTTSSPRSTTRPSTRRSSLCASGGAALDLVPSAPMRALRRAQQPAWAAPPPRSFPSWAPASGTPPRRPAPGSCAGRTP
jgi:hypothetical protein